MIYIISGTNRKKSRTFEISKIVQNEFQKNGVETQIIDLSALPFEKLHALDYGKDLPDPFAKTIQNLNQADGIYIVTPEYNGSIPGALKYFIDHFSYPITFEHRPVALTGLGFRFGGLRPVEHLQQVFNYRNAYIFPQRIFLSNITDVLKEGALQDENVKTLLKLQVSGFVKFIKALKSEKLDANSMHGLST